MLTDVPILFLSAYGGRYSESMRLAAGGNKLITKPVDFVELTSVLTELRLQRVIELRRPKLEVPSPKASKLGLNEQARLP